MFAELRELFLPSSNPDDNVGLPFVSQTFEQAEVIAEKRYGQVRNEVRRFREIRNAVFSDFEALNPDWHPFWDYDFYAVVQALENKTWGATIGVMAAFQFIEELEGSLRGMKAMDFGSGYASLLHLLQRTFGVQAYGIEFHPETHKLAQETLRRMGLENDIKIACGNYFFRNPDMMDGPEYRRAVWCNLSDEQIQTNLERTGDPYLELGIAPNEVNIAVFYQYGGNEKETMEMVVANSEPGTYIVIISDGTYVDGKFTPPEKARLLYVNHCTSVLQVS